MSPIGVVAWWAGLSQQARGTAISLAGILVLSPDTLCIRLVNGVDNWTVMFFRYLLQGLTMLFVFVCTEGTRAPGKMWSLGRLGCIAGLIWGASNILFTLAVQNTAVANVLVILAGGDLFFATVLSYLILGEGVPPHTLVCCACCFAAILLTFSDQLQGGGAGITGNIYAIFASVTMAGYFVALRLASVQGRSLDMVPTNIIAGCFVGFISLCFGARPGSVSMIMLIETILGPVWVALGGFEAPPANTIYGGLILIVSLIAHSTISLRLEAAAKKAEHEAKVKEEEKEGENCEAVTLTLEEIKSC